MSGESLALVFKITADASQASSEIKRLRSTVQSEVTNIVRAFPGGNYLAPFVNELTRGGSVAKKELGDISTGAAGLGGALTGLSNPALIAVAGITAVAGAAVTGVGALYNLVTRTADQTSKFVDLAAKTSVSVETLSAFDAIAEKSGTTTEAFANGLVKFTNNLAAAESGSKSFQAIFRQVGITDFQDSEKALSQFLTYFAKLRTEQDKTQAASAVFGARVGASFVSMFNEVGGDLEKFKQKIFDAGLGITTEEARQADQLDDLRKDVEKQLGAAERQFAQEFYPTVIKVLGDFTQWLRDNKSEIHSWGSAIAEELSGDIEWLKNFNREMQEASDWLDKQAGFHPFSNIGNDEVDKFFGLNKPQKRFGQDKPDSLLDPNLFAIAVQKSGTQKDPLRDKDFTPPGKGGGGGDSAAQRAARQALEMARVDLQTAKRVNDERLEDERRAFEKGIEGLAAYRTNRIELATELYNSQKAIFAKEREEIEASVLKEGEKNVRLKKLAEEQEAARNKYARDILKATQDELDERERLEREHDENVLRIKEEGYAAQNDLDRRAAEQGLKLFTEVEDKRWEREKEILNERKRLLRERIQNSPFGGSNIGGPEFAGQFPMLSPDSPLRKQIEEEIDDINSKLEIGLKKHNALMEDSRLQDLQAAKAYIQKLRDIYASTISINQATYEIETRLMESAGASRREIIERQANLERARESERTRLAILALEDERDLINAQVKDEKERARLIKAIDAEIEAEKRRHAAAIKEIMADAYRDANKGFFSGEFRGALPTVTFDENGQAIEHQASAAQNAIEGVKSALKDFESMGKQAFGSFAEGLGSMVESWVLLGKVGPDALRKMTASILAEMAKQATVKGLMALADGLVDLFLNPAKAAADFAAAAIYFSIAGTAAVIGRGVAGNSFAQQSAGGTSTTSPSSTGAGVSSKPATIEVGRTRGEPRYGTGAQGFQPGVQYVVVEHQHTVSVQLQEGLVGKHVEQSIRSNSAVQDALEQSIVEHFRSPGRVRNEAAESLRWLI